MSAETSAQSSLAAVKIPRPEELFETQSKEEEARNARREHFMATKGESVAKTIIEELLAKIQAMSYARVLDGRVCQVDVIGMCNDDEVLAEKVLYGIVRPLMRAAGWSICSSVGGGVFVRIDKKKKEESEFVE